MSGVLPEASASFELDGFPPASGGSGEPGAATGEAAEWVAVWEGAKDFNEDGAWPDTGSVLEIEAPAVPEEEDTRKTALLALLPAVVSTMQTLPAETTTARELSKPIEPPLPEALAADAPEAGAGSAAWTALMVQRDEINQQARPTLFGGQAPELSSAQGEDTRGQRIELLLQHADLRQDASKPGVRPAESGGEPARGWPAQAVADVVLQPAGRSGLIRHDQPPSPLEADGCEPDPGSAPAARSPEAKSVERARVSDGSAFTSRADGPRQREDSIGAHRGFVTVSQRGASGTTAIESELPHGAGGPAETEGDPVQPQREMTRGAASAAAGDGAEQTPAAAPPAQPAAHMPPSMPSMAASEFHSGRPESMDRPIRSEAAAAQPTKAGSPDAAGLEHEPAGNRLQGHLDIQLDGRAGERVRIRLAEAPGGVRLRMASNDARLAQSLRSEWRTLEAALRDAGWGTQPEASGPADSLQAGWRWTDSQADARWVTEGRAATGTGEPASVQDRRQQPPADSQPQQGRREGQDGAREELEDLTAIRRLGRRRQE